MSQITWKWVMGPKNARLRCYIVVLFFSLSLCLPHPAPFTPPRPSLPRCQPERCGHGRQSDDGHQPPCGHSEECQTEELQSEGGHLGWHWSGGERRARRHTHESLLVRTTRLYHQWTWATCLSVCISLSVPKSISLSLVHSLTHSLAAFPNNGDIFISLSIKMLQQI